jgi:ParB/RepB/Spo0J family partition protein
MKGWQMGAVEKVAEIELKKIVVSKTNPRKNFDKAGLKELQDSIKMHGILQPLLVRPAGKNGYELVCGERRYRAAKENGLIKVPVRVMDLNDEQALEVQMVENLQRSDIHPLEEAEGYEKLMKSGMDIEDLAVKVGKGKSYVYGRIKLCALVPKCRKMFYEGALTPSTAILIARMPEDVQIKAAEQIVDGYDGPMSLNNAREVIQRDFMLNLKDMPFAKNDKICPERGSCTTCPKRTKNDALLFEDIGKDDNCTDAVCFNAKRQAVIDLAVDKAKKTGNVVVDTEKVFPYGNHVGGGYSSLGDTCYDDPEKRTYKELLKVSKDFKPCVCVDNSGKIVEIVKPAELVKSLKASGVIPKEKKEVNPDDEAKVVRELVHQKAVLAVMNKVKDDVDQGFLTLIAEIVIENATPDQHKIVVKRIEPDPVKDAKQYLLDLLKTMEASDIPQLVLALLVAPSYSGFYVYSEDLTKALAFYKLDIIESLEKTSALELKAKAKAKK